MTRSHLMYWVKLTVTIYVVVMVLGIALKARFPADNDPVYNLYKDLLTPSLAVPAAWLVYCFQCRHNYMQQLRKLWSDVISAVQLAVQYTHKPDDNKPTQHDYGIVLLGLSRAIEEVRGVFKNIGEKPSGGGVYPFEGIKAIHTLISELGYKNEYTLERARVARKLIIAHWQTVRNQMLREFDRDFPTYPSSPYIAEANE